MNEEELKNYVYTKPRTVTKFLVGKDKELLAFADELDRTERIATLESDIASIETKQQELAVLKSIKSSS